MKFIKKSCPSMKSNELKRQPKTTGNLKLPK